MAALTRLICVSLQGRTLGHYPNDSPVLTASFTRSNGNFRGTLATVSSEVSGDPHDSDAPNLHKCLEYAPSTAFPVRRILTFRMLVYN